MEEMKKSADAFDKVFAANNKILPPLDGMYEYDIPDIKDHDVAIKKMREYFTNLKD